MWQNWQDSWALGTEGPGSFWGLAPRSLGLRVQGLRPLRNTEIFKAPNDRLVCMPALATIFIVVSALEQNTGPLTRAWG